MIANSSDRITGDAPSLNITKLGIVSRDYGHRFGNGNRDFSHALPKVLKILDDQGCDAVLFSLFSIDPRTSNKLSSLLNSLLNVNAVFLEEYTDNQENRLVGRYVVHHRTTDGWREYELFQRFPSLTEMSETDMINFVQDEMPKRILGNCCVLLCGESNSVKYSRNDREIQDNCRLRSSIPDGANIVLNPYTAE
jgi:hypothetical protein